MRDDIPLIDQLEFRPVPFQPVRTPELPPRSELEQRAADVRATWSSRETDRRRVVPHVPYEIPVVSCSVEVWPDETP